MQLKIGSHSIPIPAARWLRIALGALLVIGGLTSILPLLGIWMLPLGIFFLSIDIPVLKPANDYFTKKTRQWLGVDIKKQED